MSEKFLAVFKLILIILIILLANLLNYEKLKPKKYGF